MAARLGVTPGALRGVGRDVGEIGFEVAQVVASLRAQFAGEAAGAACAITQGDAASFWASCGDSEQKGASLAGAINQLGDSLGRAANIFEQSDQGSARGA
jgi:Excreted virulence factor EspC, type VII ESX diderm